MQLTMRIADQAKILAFFMLTRLHSLNLFTQGNQSDEHEICIHTILSWCAFLTIKELVLQGPSKEILNWSVIIRIYLATRRNDHGNVSFLLDFKNNNNCSFQAGGFDEYSRNRNFSISITSTLFAKFAALDKIAALDTKSMNSV